MCGHGLFSEIIAYTERLKIVYKSFVALNLRRSVNIDYIKTVIIYSMSARGPGPNGRMASGAS
jgi:hypothetical protein